MDNQTVTEKKPIAGLIIPIISIILTAVAVLAYVLLFVVFPMIYGAVVVALTVLGMIPIVGLLFSLLLAIINIFNVCWTFISPVVWVLVLGAAIAGIVLGIIGIVKSRKLTGGSRRVALFLSILSVVLAALLIIAMLVLLAITVIWKIIEIIGMICLAVFDLVFSMVGGL